MYCYKNMRCNEDENKSLFEILLEVFSNPINEIKELLKDMRHDWRGCDDCRRQYSPTVSKASRFIDDIVEKILRFYSTVTSDTGLALAPLVVGGCSLATGSIFEALKNASASFGMIVMVSNCLKTAALTKTLVGFASRTKNFAVGIRRTVCRCLLLFCIVVGVRAGLRLAGSPFQFLSSNFQADDLLKLYAACILALLGVRLCGKNLSTVLSIISLVDIKDSFKRGFGAVFKVYAEVISKVCSVFGLEATAETIRKSVDEWNDSMTSYTHKEFSDNMMRTYELVNCKRSAGHAYGTQSLSNKITAELELLNPNDPKLSSTQRESVLSAIKALSVLRADNDWRIKCGQARCAPYGMMVVGAPGIGKTFACTKLVQAFWSCLKPRAPPGVIEPSLRSTSASSNIMFARNTSQDFFEGYMCQPVVFYSDLFRFWLSKDHTAQERQTKELVELQDIIDTAPFYPNFGALQTGQEPGKGMAISPNLVLGTSNYMYIDTKADEHILGRRIKMTLLVVLVSDDVKKTPDLKHLRFFRKKTPFNEGGPGGMGKDNWRNPWGPENQVPKTLVQMQTWPWKNDFEEIEITSIVERAIAEYIDECNAFLGLKDAANPFIKRGETPVDVIEPEEAKALNLTQDEILVDGQTYVRSDGAYVLKCLAGEYNCDGQFKLIPTSGSGNNCLFFSILESLGRNQSKSAAKNMRKRVYDSWNSSVQKPKEGEMISDDQFKEIERILNIQICLHTAGLRYIQGERDGRRLVHIDYRDSHFSALQECEPDGTPKRTVQPETLEQELARYNNLEIQASELSVASKEDLDEYAGASRVPTFDELSNMAERALRERGDLNEKDDDLDQEVLIDDSDDVVELKPSTPKTSVFGLTQEDIEKTLREIDAKIVNDCSPQIDNDGDLADMYAAELPEGEYILFSRLPKIVKSLKSMLYTDYGVGDIGNPVRLNKTIERKAFVIGPFKTGYAATYALSLYNLACKFGRANLLIRADEKVFHLCGNVMSDISVWIVDSCVYVTLPPTLCSYFTSEPQSLLQVLENGVPLFYSPKNPVQIKSGFLSGDGFRTTVPELAKFVASCHGLSLNQLLVCMRDFIPEVSGQDFTVVYDGEVRIPDHAASSVMLRVARKGVPKVVEDNFMSRHFARIREWISTYLNPSCLSGIAITSLAGALLNSIYKLFKRNPQTSPTMHALSVTSTTGSKININLVNNILRRFGGSLIWSEPTKATVEVPSTTENEILMELEKNRYRAGELNDFDSMKMRVNLPNNLKRSQFVLVSVKDKNLKRNVAHLNGLVLQGGIVMFPRHLIEGYKDEPDRFCIVVGDKEYQMRNVSKAHFTDRRDLCIVTKYNMFGPGLGQSLFSAKMPPQNSVVHAVIFRKNKSVDVQQCRLASTEEEVRKVSATRGSEVQIAGYRIIGAQVDAGECGSLLVHNGKIFAILSAGVPGEDAESLWSAVSDQDVTRVVRDYGDPDWPVAKATALAVECGVNHPKRSNRIGHQTSNFHDFEVEDMNCRESDGWERTEVADQLDPAGDWCPANTTHRAWLNCCRKFPVEEVPCLPKEVYDAAEIYKNLWKPTEKFVMIKSMKAAVNGYVAEDMKYQVLKPVDLSKAPGKPFTDHGRHKWLPESMRGIHDKRPLYDIVDGYLQPKPELERMANEILDAWFRGECPRVPYTINLKHEIRTRQQYDSAKARLFVQPPHHLNVALRMLLGRWAGEMKRRGRKLMHAIGVDVHSSSQWQNILNHVKRPGFRALGPDFSGYDCSHTSEMMMIVADIIASYYEPKYRKAIMAAVLSCGRFEFRDGDFHVSNAGFSSGSQITTQMNCVFTSLLYIAFAIREWGSWERAQKHFRFVCYGDDCLIGVDKNVDDGFVPRMVAFMRECNYKLTSGDKSDLTELLDFDDVTFLKRRFALRAGVLRAPLPFKQIFKPVLYYPQDCQDKEECRQSALRAMALEIAELDSRLIDGVQAHAWVTDKLRSACLADPLWASSWKRAGIDLMIENFSALKSTDELQAASSDLPDGGHCEWAF